MQSSRFRLDWISILLKATKLRQLWRLDASTPTTASFEARASFSAQRLSGQGPVAGYPGPSVGALVPVTLNPIGTCVGPLDIVAANPEPVRAGPVPMARIPDEGIHLGLGRWIDRLELNGGRRFRCDDLEVRRRKRGRPGRQRRQPGARWGRRGT